MATHRPQLIFEFTSAALKICRSVWQGRRGRVLTHCSSLPAEGLNGDLSRRIRRHLRVNRIAAEGAVLVVPRTAALWRSFRLPARSLKEVREMLSWRLRRETGGEAGRSVIYDFRVVGYDGNGYAVACVFFSPADRILPYVRVLEQAEILPREVTLSTQGLVEWVALDAPAEANSYILHAGREGHEFCATQAGVPVFSRTFCLSRRPADRPASLLREVKISFEMFRRLKRMPGEAFKGLHVVGRLDRAEAAALAPYLKSLSETDATFSTAIGLVLRPGNARIDMMPALLRQRVSRVIAWQKGLRCFVAIYCFVWLVFFSSWLGVVRHAQATAAYRAAWQQAQPDVERFRARAGRAAFAREAWGPAGVSVLLDEIFGNVPDGTVLTRIRAERGVFSFSGLAPDAATVLALRGALASSARFADVLLDFVGREAGEERQRFSMRCVVKI